MTIKNQRKPRVGIFVLAGGNRALFPESAPGRPKLLEDIHGQPVLHYVIQTAKNVKSAIISGITVVVSSHFEGVLRNSLLSYPDVNIAVQDRHLGTLDAVWSAVQQGECPLSNEADYIVILLGDQPLITSDDIDHLIDGFNLAPDKWAGITTFRENREVLEYGKCAKIFRQGRRFLDLKPRAPMLKDGKKEELHAGPYIFSTEPFMSSISVWGDCTKNVSVNASESHLYVILRAALRDTGVYIHCSKHPTHYLGVDTLEGLALARKRMQRRRKK